MWKSGMVISHNLVAMNAQRQFNIVGNIQKKSVEKLSSGYKINRAADDAAGLAISEKMRRQIRGLDQGARNISDGIGFVQVGDGALAEVDDMLHRLTELSVKSANGTLTNEDRSAIQQEVNQIVAEIDRIGKTTTFNERHLLIRNRTRLVMGRYPNWLPVLRRKLENWQKVIRLVAYIIQVQALILVM